MAAYPSSASVRRTPLVKRNYCLRSHLRGLVFTLNHIAVIEDSAIVCAHDSDRHHENHHWRRRRRPHPRRWGWGRPRRRWRWRPLRPKTAFPLRLRPFGPRGGIVGRSARAALIPRRYLRLKRATREPGFTPIEYALVVSGLTRKAASHASARRLPASEPHNLKPYARRSSVTQIGWNGRSSMSSPIISAVPAGTSRHTPGRWVNGSETTTRASSPKCISLSLSG